MIDWCFVSGFFFSGLVEAVVATGKNKQLNERARQTGVASRPKSKLLVWF